jgi:hypothetical protein
MPTEILASDVDAETRQRTARLLRQKLGRPFEKLDDVIGMLQLMLIADENTNGPTYRGTRRYASNDVVALAGEKVVRAMQVATHGAETPDPTANYGYNPRNFMPEGTTYLWQFHEVRRAMLPLRSSDMQYHEERQSIILRAINEIRVHERLLRIVFISISNTHFRRTQLREFFRGQWGNANRGQVLVNVIDFAARQVRHTPSPALLMMDDLFAVIIGNNMLEGRLNGQYFGGNLNGATGFKPNLRDRHNQIQHAVAGLVIGHRCGVIGTAAAAFVDWLKEEPQDVDLYWASYWAARNLSDGNYMGLSEAVRREICDTTVTRAP